MSHEYGTSSYRHILLVVSIKLWHTWRWYKLLTAIKVTFLKYGRNSYRHISLLTDLEQMTAIAVQDKYNSVSAWQFPITGVSILHFWSLPVTRRFSAVLNRKYGKFWHTTSRNCREHDYAGIRRNTRWLYCHWIHTTYHIRDSG